MYLFNLGGKGLSLTLLLRSSDLPPSVVPRQHQRQLRRLWHGSHKNSSTRQLVGVRIYPGRRRERTSCAPGVCSPTMPPELSFLCSPFHFECVWNQRAEDCRNRPRNDQKWFLHFRWLYQHVECLAARAAHSDKCLRNTTGSQEERSLSWFPRCWRLHCPEQSHRNVHVLWRGIVEWRPFSKNGRSVTVRGKHRSNGRLCQSFVAVVRGTIDKVVP